MQTLENIITSQLGPDLKSFDHNTTPVSVMVFPASIVRTLTILRDHPELNFLQLVDLTAVDYPQRTQRFEIAYHLLSHTKNHRIIVKIQITEATIVPSVIGTFPNANWYEREVWDLFGIAFENHPDLRRILCDYNFSGHPLRKDFPLSGYSEVFFNEETHRVEYKKLNLEQPFRNFDFLSPWEGRWQDLLKAETEAHK